MAQIIADVLEGELDVVLVHKLGGTGPSGIGDWRRG
jgi:hypothetical protein